MFVNFTNTRLCRFTNIPQWCWKTPQWQEAPEHLCYHIQRASLWSWFWWLIVNVYNLSTRSRLKKSKANCKPSSPVHLPPPGKHHRRDPSLVVSTEEEESRFRHQSDGILSHKSLSLSFPRWRWLSRWRSGGCNAWTDAWSWKVPAGKVNHLLESTL